MIRLPAVVAAVALAACSPAPPADPAPLSPAPVEPSLPTDAWVGQWTGVEGTFLRIERGDVSGNYTLTEGTLDGVVTFEGRAEGDAIVFDRDGVAEAIRAGDGAATGLKWLDGKTDCLVIREGEGFCR